MRLQGLHGCEQKGINKIKVKVEKFDFNESAIGYLAPMAEWSNAPVLSSGTNWFAGSNPARCNPLLLCCNF